MRLWARPSLDMKLCRIVGDKGGSFLTACRGRFPVSEVLLEEIGPGDPPKAEQCGGCARADVGDRFDLGGEG